jgi:hypothetical protein
LMLFSRAEVCSDGSDDVLSVHNGRMVHPLVPDYEVDHSKFRADLAVVRRYAESHTDDYVEVRFENDPTIRLIVLMVGDHISEHEAALRGLVDHPNQLEVRPTPYSRVLLEGIRREVREMVADRPGSFMQLGIGKGRVDVQLAADQINLAAQLHDRFADAVELRVGVFPYPPATKTVDSAKDSTLASRPTLPLLPEEEFDVSLESEIVVGSGRTTHGALLIHNRGRAEVVIDTNGGVTARVVDPQSGNGVGGFFGAQAAPLFKYTMPPAGTVSIPLLVGTASSVRTLGYAVPPGQWAIEVPIHIAGRGQFRTPLLPLLIVPSLEND